MDSAMNGNKKSSICRYFASDGICFYGSECQFWHSQTQPRTFQPMSDQPHMPPDSRHNWPQNNGNCYYGNESSVTSQLNAMNIDSQTTRATRRPMTSSANSSPMMTQQTNVQALGPTFFMTDSIKHELIRKLAATQEMSPNELYLDLPQVVDVFQDLVPLEASMSSPSTTFNGMITSVMRATNVKTGQLFCLRRLHGYQPNSANAKVLINSIDSWKKLYHSNIVQLRQVFTTKAFGDNSFVFVYDHHSTANTLLNHYFSHASNSSNTTPMNGYSTSSRPYSQQQSQRKLLPEPLIWNFIIQISSALRAIHSAGLSCRALDPTKIIITSGSNTSGAHKSQEYPRLRLSGCGVFDILSNESFLTTNNPKILQHFQQEDLIAFGKLCMSLATNSLSAASQRDNWQTSLDLISRNYSADLRSLIFYLLSYKSNSGTTHTINDIMPMIGARFYTQLDTLYQRDDALVDDLSKELDNGRIVRLLIKLGTINERPELQMDPNWSETGDRYLLKLFRDYLFHQYGDDGRPWLDMSHIVANLNKLDVGSPEKICLISRDEQNILIVSFAELKRCFESSLNELLL